MYLAPELVPPEEEALVLVFPWDLEGDFDFDLCLEEEDEEEELKRPIVSEGGWLVRGAFVVGGVDWN